MSNILIIDSDKIFAANLAAYLESNNHRVDIRYSAQDGVLSVDDSRPDLILLEVLLRQNNGIEFLYELRSYSDWHDIPVIIVSRVSSDELGIDNSAMKSLGVIDCLYKPSLRMSKLLHSIDSLPQGGQASQRVPKDD